MNLWIRILFIMLLVIGCIWCLVGICGVYDKLDNPPTKYSDGGPQFSEAILVLVSSLSAAGLCWGVAAGIYFGYRHNSTLYLMLTEYRKNHMIKDE